MAKQFGGGLYIFESLIEQAPLSEGSHITCCEFWDSNLYIGTSASEVLHFVSIPDESSSRAQFILASRLEPTPASTEPSKGVQQIIILSRAGKACILCNGALTFHSLPELSPIGGRKVSGCTWVGGKDLNLGESGSLDDAATLLVCTRKRTRVVRVGDEAQVIRNIEFPDCLAVARRGRFACVADSHSYSLLDVENQQKIPLFPISSLDDTATPTASKQVVNVPGDATPRRDLSPAARSPARVMKAHGRATSLGQIVSSLRSRGNDESSPSRAPLEFNESEGDAGPPSSDVRKQHDGLQSPQRSVQGTSREASPSRPAPQSEVKPFEPLMPSIVSPLPTEFLVTVGTDPRGPAMGMFVNCDGDVARGNLNFSSYPYAVALDEGNADPSRSSAPGNGGTNKILAAMRRQTAKHVEWGIETQDWDGKSGSKSWLSLASEKLDSQASASHNIGVTSAETPLETSLPAIGDKLRAQLFRPYGKTVSRDSSSSAAYTKRVQQEEDFAKRLGASQSRMIVWCDHKIGVLVLSPMLTQLESTLDERIRSASEPQELHSSLVELMLRVRKVEPQSESEYLSLEYVSQKISIVLFVELALHRFDVDSRFREELLVASSADPRIVLSMVPLLRRDIFTAKDGMWVQGGLVELLADRYREVAIGLDSDDILSRPEEYDVHGLLKRYLMAWRQRKGFGSIADEAHVFSTVDAALIHLLLHQDQQSTLGPGGSSTLRAEIYSIVDSGVDCFEHAVALLEEYGRLYILSRLYQSRRMSAKVLATWKRILDEGLDPGGEFADGENEVRRYLAKRGDAALVEEYGVWLAKRNPDLGVQVFTDDHSKVRLPPRQVIQLLQSGAPDAVKPFLEHLVFGKKEVGYANDLIAYYLNSVFIALSSSPEAKSAMVGTYDAYRALRPPKPTYRQFITDNAPPVPWWSDRLRLLELLGGTYGTGLAYDVPAVSGRIYSFEDALVPESIILEGRQGHHERALHLLVHGMGDFHTAINYCLLGGSSIFHPALGSVDSTSRPGPREQATLFRYLLHEFLQITDDQVRLEQTGELLSRFGPWFDLRDVLEAIPATWPVEAVSTFLCFALRRLWQERNETMVLKALRGLENIKSSAQLADECEKFGPKIVPATETPESMG